jgi:phenylacetic acid degradation operon negative regulatory protein
MVAEYEPLGERRRRGLIGTAEALTARTALMDSWRNLPGLDPELPTELLPPDWPRAQAREIFIELYDGLAELAEARVRQIVSTYDAALASLVSSHSSDFPA